MFQEWKEWNEKQRIFPQLAAKFLDSPTSGNENSVDSSSIVSASRVCISCKLVRLKKEFSVVQWKKKGNKCLKCIEKKSNETEERLDEEFESDSESNEIFKIESESDSLSESIAILNFDSECCICLSEKSEPFESICGHSAHLLHSQCLQDWKLQCRNNFNCPICRAPPSEK